MAGDLGAVFRDSDEAPKETGKLLRLKMRPSKSMTIKNVVSNGQVQFEMVLLEGHILFGSHTV